MPEPPGRFVTVDGDRLHVVDEGSGAPLLLMAALGSNWFDLDPLATRLVIRGWRVIRYDRPGYGLSDSVRRGRVPTLDAEISRMSEVLASLGVTAPVTLVGHSMASLYVEGFARAHPSNTAGVVILDGSYVLVPWRLVPARFRVGNAHRAMSAVRAVGDRTRIRIRGRGRLRTKVLPAPPEGFDANQHFWGDHFFGSAGFVLATLVENAAFPTINASLRRLRRTRPMPAVPVIVVAALSGMPAWQRFWRAKQRRYADVVGGRLRTVEARHFLVLEKPDEVADIVGEVWLDGRAPQL
ncbi:alpha/beta hydrolase [Gordonia sp. NPDC003585]|uniref:alpha/beta hydrolase n=1 Tax=Gordonia sp. NPDC003585 TaxID=3154275 RepID=UPI0033AE4926